MAPPARLVHVEKRDEVAFAELIPIDTCPGMIGYGTPASRP
jgi:hypothetical protein